MMKESILYMVATPIGNLDDMTFRAVKTLKEVDVIAAEDTRQTRKLLTHFDIHTPLMRYDENNKDIIGCKIIDRLKNGESVACVSDAGMPAISDPGADLVKQAIDENIKVVPIPGANAALTAIICSGLDTRNFEFVGFLPKTKKNLQKELSRIKAHEATLIFYESPHHIKTTIEILLKELGNRQAVIARELTKIHEEFIRGNLSSLLEKIESKQIGEFVIIVAGAKVNEFVENVEKTTEVNLIDVYNKYVTEGLNKKEAMRETAKQLNISRREVYNTLLK